MLFIFKRRLRQHFQIATTSALASLLAVSSLHKQCITQSPAKTSWGSKAISAYLDSTRARTIADATSKGLSLPKDFLAWVNSDATLRASVYGCRKDPLPVLLQLRSLEIELGKDIVRRDYTQLALAFAIQRSYMNPRKKASTWNDGDAEGRAGNADIKERPLLQLKVPSDPRTRINTKDPDRQLDRDDHIINFLEDHKQVATTVTTKEFPPLEYDAKGVAKKRGRAVKVTKTVMRDLVGADVIASVDLQKEFQAYMSAHGFEIALDCGDQVVHWKSKAAVKDKALRTRIKEAHDLFHNAYRNKGRMPTERDAAPSAAESMAWLIRNDRYEFPESESTKRKAPQFPLTAPWPVLLMLASDDQPLREREEIWVKYRDLGEFRTYGEYIGAIAQQFDMQSARRVSPFAFSYGSIQMMWKDGGVCGTMGNIGARTYRICGIPSSTAGQPGHCALVRMDMDPKTGAFRCIGGQYATGGDEATTVHASWNYDDIGGRKPMVFHQSIAWGVNQGLASFVDTLVMRRMWDAADDKTKNKHGTKFIRTAMRKNVFALAAILGAIQSAANTKAATSMLGAFNKCFDAFAKPDQYKLYRTQVRDLTHAKVLACEQPKTKSSASQLLSALERQGCTNAQLLAKTWRKIGGEEEFTKRCIATAKHYVANKRNKASSTTLNRMIKTWARTIKNKASKVSWASAMLTAFEGKETMRIGRKTAIDPVVIQLCKLAGRQPPKLAK